METITQKLMLYFPKCECEKPIIYHLVKDYGLVVNIFRAKVTPEEEGYLVLDVTGTEQEIEAGIAFVKTFNVVVNLSGKGVTRDEDRCNHCGYCVTYCPTDSLRIGDERTRKVVYDEAKCIECLACVRVCPYGACTAVF
jgi:NAD-dependent dihydropyrimidine dehydrogenase PreA subunit